jgi:hypothetical protein
MKARGSAELLGDATGATVGSQARDEHSPLLEHLLRVPSAVDWAEVERVSSWDRLRHGTLG